MRKYEQRFVSRLSDFHIWISISKLSIPTEPYTSSKYALKTYNEDKHFQLIYYKEGTVHRSAIVYDPNRIPVSYSV